MLLIMYVLLWIIVQLLGFSKKKITVASSITYFVREKNAKKFRFEILFSVKRPRLQSEEPGQRTQSEEPGQNLLVASPCYSHQQTSLTSDLCTLNFYAYITNSCTSGLLRPHAVTRYDLEHKTLRTHGTTTPSLSKIKPAFKWQFTTSCFTEIYHAVNKFEPAWEQQEIRLSVLRPVPCWTFQTKIWQNLKVWLAAPFRINGATAGRALVPPNPGSGSHDHGERGNDVQSTPDCGGL